MYKKYFVFPSQRKEKNIRIVVDSIFQLNEIFFIIDFII